MIYFLKYKFQKFWKTIKSLYLIMENKIDNFGGVAELV